MNVPTATPTPTEPPDQPDGIQAEHLDDYRIPTPSAAAARVVEFVKWFGDGIVRQDEPDEPPLYARDLCALACAVLHGYRADQPSRCMHTPAPSPAVSAPDLDAIREPISTASLRAIALSDPEDTARTGALSLMARLAADELDETRAALTAAHAETERLRAIAYALDRLA